MAKKGAAYARMKSHVIASASHESVVGMNVRVDASLSRSIQLSRKRPEGGTHDHILMVFQASYGGEDAQSCRTNRQNGEEAKQRPGPGELLYPPSKEVLDRRRGPREVNFSVARHPHPLYPAHRAENVSSCELE